MGDPMVPVIGCIVAGIGVEQAKTTTARVSYTIIWAVMAVAFVMRVLAAL